MIATLQARKFFCDNRSCERRIFCERFMPAIKPYARMTARFEDSLTALALTCSAMAGARLGGILGLPGSASTLLRCAHRYVPPEIDSDAISVDDFAFARGRRYGTIIVDLHTRRPLELLDERSVDSLRRYRAAHPQVHTIARDRDPRYAEAIAWEAPTATVIVDRWHLLRNLADAFERLVAQKHRAWRQELRTALNDEADKYNQQSQIEASEPAPLPERPRRISKIDLRKELRRRAHLEHRQQLLDEAHDLARAGVTKGDIAQRLGIDRATLNTYLQRDTPPDFSRREPTPSPLDAHYQHLAGRWRDGCRNAAQLTREIRQHGYTGSSRAVMRYVRQWRHDTNSGQAARPPPAPITPALPGARALAWQLLSDQPNTTAQALLKRVPDAQHHSNLARAGSDAIRQHNHDAWNAWLTLILAGPDNQLRRFARSLKRDHDAISNALTLPYSNGPTEGNINRLKLIKRTMYGRASFQLLRNKTLYQAT